MSGLHGIKSLDLDALTFAFSAAIGLIRVSLDLNDSSMRRFQFVE